MLKKKFKYLAYASLSVFSFSLNRCSSSTEDTAKIIQIPFSLTYQPSATKLTQDASLELAPTVPTNIQLYVANCLSGYTDSITLSSATIGLFTSDKNCLVRLISFTLGSTTYSSSGVNVINFSTWLANDTATFQSTTLATDVIKVFCISQVTQAGVTGSDTISYKFTDIQSLTTSSLAQANITYSNSISVTGDPAPNVTMLQARVLSGNANGSFNMSFTLQCGVSVTGSTPTYQCSGVQMNTRFDYILVMDTYSQSALTVAQLTAAFAANTPTTVGSLVVGNGGSDLNTNVLSTGGFYTSNASPLVTGTSAVYSGNPNMVFMVRQKDATVTNVQSYTYFYIDLPAENSSGCGTTFTAGAGTSTNPYLIATATDLANTVNCTSSSVYFIQVQNIDLTSISWVPMTLYGQYNGNNFTISNLSVTDTSTAANTWDGLFNNIASGASVSYLNLVNASVSSQGNGAGLLAGENNGTITSCTVSGTVTHTLTVASYTANVGGLVGINYNGSITSSSSSANVIGNVTGSGSGTYTLGGLEGSNNNAITTTTSSFSTGNVSISSVTTSATTFMLGSLVGAMNGSVTNSYATGNVTFPAGATGSTVYAGTVGNMNSGTLTGNFSKGTFTVSSGSTVRIGGMIGVEFTGPFTVSNNYTMVGLSATGPAAGNIGGFVGFSAITATGISSSYVESPSFSTGLANKHGFIGNTGTTIATSYYFTNSGAIPSDTSTGVTGLATQTAMQTITNYTGFIFGTSSTDWMMPTASTYSSPSGFLSPVFYWQCGTNGIVCGTTYNHPTIANGSFESGTYGGTAGSFQTLAAGSTNITGWTISLSSLDWINAPYWQASNGSFSIDLNGTAASALSQTLSTTSGSTYLVNFDFAGNYACVPVVKTITVSAASNTTNYSFDTTGKSASNMGYVTVNFMFVATSSSTTFTITSTTTGGCGPVVDNVR